MAADNERGALFRPIVPNQHSRVTYAELFFDLVFVFAVTQVSHPLLGRFTPIGALQITMLFLAVWWVWVYTSWITNWLNPELTPVPVLLMLGGLVLSTSIPRAFESRGLWFAVAYTYLHMPIVAGIILSAVANELVLTHPAEHSDPRTVLSAIGGPLLFLIGTILFKHTIRGWLQPSHGAGIVALAILGWFASGLSPLMLSILTSAIMIVVAVWESISLGSGAREARSEETQSDATSA